MENTLEYKIRLWEKLQGIVIENESRNTGSISVLTIAACAASFLAIIYNNNEGIPSLFYYIIPVLIMVGLFVYTFNNRVSAITRGYLAGLEDLINEELGENIYIYNKGYKELYHIPYFIVNDAIALVYLIIIAVLSYIAFYNIFSNPLAPMLVLKLYLIVYLMFDAVCVYELQSNGRIKKIARVYFLYNYYKIDSKFNIGNIDYKMNIKEIMKEYDKFTKKKKIILVDKEE